MVIIPGGYGRTDVCMLPHGVHIGREKVWTEGTYQVHVVVHGLEVVYNHALILPFLSTPGAEGVTASPT